MRNKLLITFFILFLASTAFPLPKDDKKKEDTPSIIAPAYKEGIIYSLPTKGLKINIKTKKTSNIPGPYSQYAKKYLGIENPILITGENWELVSIGIETYSEADPNATFQIQDSIACPISLLANGIIAGIGTNGQCSTNEVIGSDFITCAKNPSTFTDLSSDDYYEIIVNPETGVETTEYKSIEDKAQEAANYLIRLRKKRAYTILSPDDVIPEDGEGYKVFVQEAIRLEHEYVSLFAGKSEESIHSFSFNFTPGKSDVKNEVLFRFSENKGILPKSDISGKPILLEITKDQALYKISDKIKTNENPEAGDRGYWYRIPVSANLKISDGVNTLYKGNTTIPQFGIVVPIPENVLNANYSIEYNTETGSLKTIKKM